MWCGSLQYSGIETRALWFMLPGTSAVDCNNKQRGDQIGQIRKETRGEYDGWLSDSPLLSSFPLASVAVGKGGVKSA